MVAILGDKATARDLVDLAELSILAAGGYVSPEAEAALSRALVLDPRDQVGRYYSALTLMQGGRPDLAYRIWSGLVAEGPADAPWIEGARAGAAEAARLAGIAPAGAAAAGPTPADVDAAEAMPPAERAGDDRGHGGAALRPARDRRAARRRTGRGSSARSACSGARDEAAAILAEARQKHAGDAGGAGRDRGGGPRRRGSGRERSRCVEDVGGLRRGAAGAAAR